MNIRTAILIVVFFLLANFFISFIATKTIPYLGYFSYPELLERFNLPWFVERFASFDGLHYIKIAETGYAFNAAAFLPLYPLLIKLGVDLTGLSPVAMGILISMTALFGTLIILPKYLLSLGLTSKQWPWIIASFLTFPTSFFLQAVYTESLFVFLVITALYFAHKRRYPQMALFGFLAGITRITGFFLAIPFFLEIAKDIHQKQQIKQYLVKLSVVTAPVFGMIAFIGFLWVTTGDPLKLLHAQVNFNQNRSTSFILPLQVIYRYIKIFLTARPNFQYFIAVVEFVTVAGVCAILICDGWKIYKRRRREWLSRAGLNLFAWGSILLPMFSGTFLSMPRFILPLVTIFIVLGELKNILLKISIMTVFTILHIILLMAFIQGYFVS